MWIKLSSFNSEFNLVLKIYLHTTNTYVWKEFNSFALSRIESPSSFDVRIELILHDFVINKSVDKRRPILLLYLFLVLENHNIVTAWCSSRGAKSLRVSNLLVVIIVIDLFLFKVMFHSSRCRFVHFVLMEKTDLMYFYTCL